MDYPRQCLVLILGFLFPPSEPPRDPSSASEPARQGLDDHSVRTSGLLPTVVGEKPVVSPSSPPAAGTVASTTDSPSKQKDSLTIQVGGQQIN